MTLRLATIEFVPNTAGGWGSGVLSFGKKITLAHGPNGSGKTPVLSGIPYCLGFPIGFRKDIKNRCNSIKLTFFANNKKYESVRYLNESFFIEVSEDGSDEIVEYKNERDYSDFLFDALNIELCEITTTGGDPAKAYVSTYFPLFCFDQLESYSTIYNSPKKFIKDQAQEMVRLALGLPPKNPYSLKKALVKERRNLAVLDEQFVNKKIVLESMVKSLLESDTRSKKELKDEYTRTKNKLRDLQDSLSSVEQSDGFYDASISDARYEIESIRSKIAKIRLRKRNLKQISEEITAEIETLSLNSEAARHFRDFSDFCGNLDCRLFSGSEEAYGKNLLYLKDQMKDIQLNIDSLSSEEAELSDLLHKKDTDLVSLDKARAQSDSPGSYERILKFISFCTSELVSLESSIKTRSLIDQHEDQLISLQNNRETSNKKIEDLVNSTKSLSSREISNSRVLLARKIDRWLSILKTKNLSGPSYLDSEFKLRIGEEDYKLLKGSTRIRCVLAFHAALLESALEIGSEHHPRLLIMDTPKQQEIEEKDLKEYFTELESVAKKYKDVQIVFSSTEYKHEVDTDDSLWIPVHPGLEQNMFLGKVEN